MSRVHPIVKLLDQPRLRVVGLMSGTSLDGIDAAIVDIEREPFTATLVAFDTRPYTDEERAHIGKLLASATPALCEGNFWLGHRFADATSRVAARVHDGMAIDLVGSHGQTVWHQPPSMTHAPHTASTLQLGEAAVIAAAARVPVVSDFRVADVALGGEGAPLVPFVDQLLYQKADTRRALQNIGGIANVTFLIAGQAPLAFDSGPGNMVADVIAEQLSGGAERFDRDGALSASGRVDDLLLAELVRADHDYLHRAPPKSTGRERYGVAFAQQLIARAQARGLPLPDLLRTVVAFTAQCIVDALKFAPAPIDEMLVSGGGVHNRTLLAEISARAPGLRIDSLARHGLDPDAKEAVAFAILAAHAVWAEPANLPSVTGARGPAILGKISLPPILS